MTLSESEDQASPSPQDTRVSQQQQASSLPPPVVDPGCSRPSRSSGSGRTRSSRRGHGHRSRSSGSRSRSRHRLSSRHHNRHNCRMYFKHKERNFASALCSMATIVLLCVALEPDWIYLTGGGCSLLHSQGVRLKHLSASQFFYNGDFYKKFPHTEDGDTIYKFGSVFHDVMVNCVTYPSVLLFKAAIGFTLIAVVCSLCAFLLDLIGPNYRLLRLIRRNALFNILTVVLCVAINLFVYLITSEVQKLQISTRLHDGSKVQVTFDISFYLITAAGGISVFATACNCLRRHPTNEYSESRPADQLYFEDTEALLPPSSNTDSAPMENLPPPPPYAP